MAGKCLVTSFRKVHSVLNKTRSVERLKVSRAFFSFLRKQIRKKTELLKLFPFYFLLHFGELTEEDTLKEQSSIQNSFSPLFMFLFFSFLVATRKWYVRASAKKMSLSFFIPNNCQRQTEKDKFVFSRLIVKEVRSPPKQYLIIHFCLDHKNRQQ